MKTSFVLPLFLGALTFACGGAQPSAAGPHGHEHSHKHGDKEHAHGHEHTGDHEHEGHGKGHGHGDHGKHDEHNKKLSPELQALHDVLAPVWHTKPPSDRTPKACAAAASLKDKAAAVKDAELSAGADALVKACADPKQAGADAALDKFHSRYHTLADAK